MALSFKKFVKGIFVQNESDRTKEVGLTVDNAASSGTNTNLVAKQTLSRTLELPDVSGVLVEKDAAQTLTNKTIDGDNNTLQDIAITSLKTELADANKFIARDVSGQVVSPNTVPNGTVVGTSDTQSLTNKTINADLNTITNIEDADIKVGAAIDAAKIHDGSVSNTEFGYLNGVTSSIQTQLNDKAEISGATDNRLVKTDGTTDIQQTGITVDDSNNVTGVNDLTVEGNLTVNGTTTTVNTATLDVEDKNITVNFNGTDVTAEGAGLTVDRTGTSGSLVYEDALPSKWKAGALGSEIELANVSSSQTLTNKTIINPIINDSINLEEESVSPASPSAGYKKIYAKTDDKLYAKNSAGTEVEILTGAVAGVPVGLMLDYVGPTAPSGYVLASGRTIGSGASGATERANSDTQTLYELLWNSYDNTILPIQDSTGTLTTRGASAALDFTANKRLPVPDLRGRVSAGKDDMGGTAANRLTSGGSGITGTTLGASGGAQTHTLTITETATHSHTDSHYHLHGWNSGGAGGNGRYGSDSATNNTFASYGGALATSQAPRSSDRVGSISNNGSGAAHNNTQPTWVINKIIKL